MISVVFLKTAQSPFPWFSVVFRGFPFQEMGGSLLRSGSQNSRFFKKSRIFRDFSRFFDFLHEKKFFFDVFHHFGIKTINFANFKKFRDF
jgi:hypothetical protein